MNWFVAIDRDEGRLSFGRGGRWAVSIRYPTIEFYRKRVHPSQQKMGKP